MIRRRHLLCPLWLLSFSLMSGWETIPHMKDEKKKSSKFPLFLFPSVFHPRPWAKYTHRTRRSVRMKRDVSDGWRERKKPEKKNGKSCTGWNPQCGSNGALTSTPAPEIEALAAQFNQNGRSLGSASLPLCYSCEIQIPGWRKLTFSSNKFTVMKIHHSFDWLFQHVSNRGQR